MAMMEKRASARICSRVSYSNRLVFNILNGPECLSGLGDRVWVREMLLVNGEEVYPLAYHRSR